MEINRINFTIVFLFLIILIFNINLVNSESKEIDVSLRVVGDGEVQGNDTINYNDSDGETTKYKELESNKTITGRVIERVFGSKESKLNNVFIILFLSMVFILILLIVLKRMKRKKEERKML